MEVQMPDFLNCFGCGSVLSWDTNYYCTCEYEFDCDHPHEVLGNQNISQVMILLPTCERDWDAEKFITKEHIVDFLHPNDMVAINGDRTITSEKINPCYCTMEYFDNTLSLTDRLYCKLMKKVSEAVRNRSDFNDIYVFSVLWQFHDDGITGLIQIWYKQGRNGRKLKRCVDDSNAWYHLAQSF